MRGPLFSGPLGHAAALDEAVRLLGDAPALAVVGPPWLAAAMRERFEVLALAVKEERDAAVKAARRAAKQGRAIAFAIAGQALPLRPASLPALLVEGLADVSHEESAVWLASLAETLRPGARLVALDATRDPALEARVAGVFMSAALMRIEQHRPRDGVLITTAVAPHAAVQAARFTPA